MDLEPETVYQIILAGGAVLLFVLVSAVVSILYGPKGELSPDGGVAMIGAIGLFIVAMLAAGLWLERQEFPETTTADTDDAGPEASVAESSQDG